VAFTSERVAAAASGGVGGSADFNLAVFSHTDGLGRKGRPGNSTGASAASLELATLSSSTKHTGTQSVDRGNPTEEVEPSRYHELLNKVARSDCATQDALHAPTATRSTIA
jgi:hypothetical protein